MISSRSLIRSENCCFILSMLKNCQMNRLMICMKKRKSKWAVLNTWERTNSYMWKQERRTRKRKFKYYCACQTEKAYLVEHLISQKIIDINSRTNLFNFKFKYFHWNPKSNIFIPFKIKHVHNVLNQIFNGILILISFHFVAFRCKKWKSWNCQTFIINTEYRCEYSNYFQLFNIFI